MVFVVTYSGEGGEESKEDTTNLGEEAGWMEAGVEEGGGESHRASEWVEAFHWKESPVTCMSGFTSRKSLLPILACR